MSDSIFLAGTRVRSLPLLLLLAMLAPLMWGCAGKRPTEPIADGQGRLRGYGFTIEPPRGKDWTVAEYAYDRVVYVRSRPTSEGRERGGKSSAQASLGVVALPAGGTVSADESGFAKAALNFLSDRFRGQPRVSLPGFEDCSLLATRSSVRRIRGRTGGAGARHARIMAATWNFSTVAFFVDTRITERSWSTNCSNKINRRRGAPGFGARKLKGRQTGFSKA